MHGLCNEIALVGHKSGREGVPEGAMERFVSEFVLQEMFFPVVVDASSEADWTQASHGRRVDDVEERGVQVSRRRRFCVFQSHASVEVGV